MLEKDRTTLRAIKACEKTLQVSKEVLFSNTQSQIEPALAGVLQGMIEVISVWQINLDKYRKGKT